MPIKIHEDLSNKSSLLVLDEGLRKTYHWLQLVNSVEIHRA